MPTLERRLSDLERARAAYSGPLVLATDDLPTPEQRRAIEDAARLGRPVVQVSVQDAQL